MELKEALNKAAQLCSKSEKCRFEIAQKLMQWGISEDEKMQILEFLETEKFIDHARYATAFAREKSKFNQWGPVKIRFELRARHIENQYIEQALALISEDTDALANERLEALLRKKHHTLRAQTPQDAKAKLVRFALSKGFELEQILPLVKKILQHGQ